MDGAKSVADTTDSLRRGNRQASYLGRNISTRRYGPDRNENPGESRI